MKCPSCENPLTSQSTAGVKVMTCRRGCGGLWFDGREIQKLQERLPGAGAALLPVERPAGVYIFRDIQHPCPRCVSTLLYRHCFSKTFQYEVDQCARCGGFWVDPGTLPEIASETSPEARADEAAAYFKSLFKDNLAPANLTHPDTIEAARRIVQIFRFLCPPALLPDYLLKTQN